MLPPPPPADSFQVVHISSLAAALAKLNINIPIEDLIKAINEEDEARRVKSTAQVNSAERHAALSKLALQPIEASVGVEITTVSKFIPNPPKPTNVDPLAKQRRRRLIELTKQAFPDGNVADPFTSTRLSLSQDAGTVQP
ncbi:hypothetical protein GALMADRAFT_139590 [Galerina marginata CBS 339.88]|uniref:Uncharacterized protein n=1 Tax=Galerina marginata (strain CBS 339.88) TaxID=685588 RepID=A0A067T9V3_GALM3|nr:hypothetical protein GALMADRAFT_139590 [Galerina marginata CBS 339.88]